DSESGHHLFREPSLWLGFCFSVAGLFIELRSIIRRTAAHPFGASATRALFNACGVSPSPAPLFKEPAHKAGFCSSVAGLFIEHR
ncbi:hypothetical protein, partial [Klebsiella quasipneumoniae]|uniref:hypothetical protein n=1 Tax=Klebsiella quasipneumoniae TaxID=1463165 RepID=UPI001B7D7E77